MSDAAGRDESSALYDWNTNLAHPRVQLRQYRTPCGHFGTLWSLDDDVPVYLCPVCGLVEGDE